MKVVFDLNKTLLKRYKTKKEFPENCVDLIKHNNAYFSLRPHINILSEFLHVHSIPYIFWSTMNQINTEDACNLLTSFTESKGCLSYDDCTTGPIKPTDIVTAKWVKDLTATKRFWESEDDINSVDDIYLVDDSIEKRKDEQNFILVKPYFGDSEDRELLSLIVYLHKLIECNNDSCIEKYTYSELPIIRSLPI